MCRGPFLKELKQNIIVFSRKIDVPINHQNRYMKAISYNITTNNNLGYWVEVKVWIAKGIHMQTDVKVYLSVFSRAIGEEYCAAFTK